MKPRVLLLGAALWLLILPVPAQADPVFPAGLASFADAVVSFDPVIKSGQPTAPYRDPSQALGAPDFPPLGYVSLGDGGTIVLQFTDNSLTGSNDSAFDLWIFEIGPDVEDTFVRISKNGIDWLAVGKVFGATSGIDVDAFGVHAGDYYSFVELRDDPNEGANTGDTVGADIDAVGAISSAPPVQMPEPATLWLCALGLTTLVARRR